MQHVCLSALIGIFGVTLAELTTAGSGYVNTIADPDPHQSANRRNQITGNVQEVLSIFVSILTV